MEFALTQFVGINNRLSPENLLSVPTREVPRPDIELVTASNVDIDDAKGLARRAGQTLKVDGSSHSLWADGQECLYVQSGDMYQLHSDFSYTLVAAGLTAAPMSYVRANRSIYHSNGTQTGVFEDGGVRAWGIPIGASTVSAARIAGNLEAGIYQYTITVRDFAGRESGAGMAQRIDLPAGSGLAFSWTVPSDPDMVEAVIYLSQPNGEVMHLAVVCDIADTQVSYAGGARSLPLATQWLDAPPAGETLALYNGRIYIGSGEFLYATAPNSYEHCDLRDYKGFDGTPIAVLAAVDTGLFVGTAKAIYFVPGASFAAQSLKRPMDTAAVRGSLVMVDGERALAVKELAGMRCAMFATKEGIVVGMPDGSLINLSAERYRLPDLSSGAAVFRQTGSASQYVLCASA